MRNKEFCRREEAICVLEGFATEWALGWGLFKVLPRAEVPVVEAPGESSLLPTATGWGLVFAFFEPN